MIQRLQQTFLYRKAVWQSTYSIINTECLQVKPGFLCITLTIIKIFSKNFPLYEMWQNDEKCKCNLVSVSIFSVSCISNYGYALFRCRSWLSAAILGKLSQFIEMKVSLIKILLKIFHGIWTDVRIWHKSRRLVFMT